MSELISKTFLNSIRSQILLTKIVGSQVVANKRSIDLSKYNFDSTDKKLDKKIDITPKPIFQGRLNASKGRGGSKGEEISRDNVKGSGVQDYQTEDPIKRDLNLRDRFMSFTFEDSRDSKKLKEISTEIRRLKVISALKDISLKASQTRISDEEFWSALIEKILEQTNLITSLPRKNMIILTYALGKLPKNIAQAFKHKVDKILSIFLKSIYEKHQQSKLDGKEISLVIFTIQKAEVYDQNFIEMALDYLNNNLNDLNYVDFTTIFYSLAKIYENQSLKKQIWANTSSNSLTIKNLVEKAYNSNPQIEEKIAAALSQADFLEKNMSNLLWALNKFNILSEKHASIAQKLLLPLLKTLGEENFKVLGATLVHSPSTNLNFNRQVKEEFHRRIREEKISNDTFIRLFRALACVRIWGVISPADKDSSVIYSNYVKSHLKEFKVEELSSIIYVFAYIYLTSDMELIKSLFAEMMTRSDKSQKPLGYGLLAWSASVLGYYERNFWEYIQRELVRGVPERLERSTARNYLQGLHTLKTKGITCSEGDAKFKQLSQKFEVFFNHIQKSQLQDLKIKFTSAENISLFDIYYLLQALKLKFSFENIVDIYSIDFFIENFDIGYINDLLSRQQPIEDVLQELKSLKNKANEMTVDFEKILTDTATYKAQSLVVLPEETVLKKNSLLIEIHGPTHYIDGKYLRGGSILKERILRDKGYKLLIISHEECRKIAETLDPKVRIDYFLNLMKAKF